MLLYFTLLYMQYNSGIKRCTNALFTVLTKYVAGYCCCRVDAYSDQHIVYKWKEGPRKSVDINADVQLPQFSVRGYRAKNKIETLSTGSTPCRYIDMLHGGP